MSAQDSNFSSSFEYKSKKFHGVKTYRFCADFFRFSSSEIPFLKERIVIRRSLICIAYTFRLILQTKHCFQSSRQNPTKRTHALKIVAVCKSIGTFNMSYKTHLWRCLCAVFYSKTPRLVHLKNLLKQNEKTQGFLSLMLICFC